MAGETVVILGGYGMVGMQTARVIARAGAAKCIVLASLHEHEAEAARSALAKEFPYIEFEACHGNIFVREEFAFLPRSELLSSRERILQIYQDTFGPIDPDDPNNIVHQCLLVKIIRKYKPDVLMDAINTATGISYQDVKSSTHQVLKFHENASRRLDEVSAEDLESARGGDAEAVARLADTLAALKHDYRDRLGEEDRAGAIDNRLQVLIQLISQIVPQLVRHVILLHRSCRESRTRLYLKIGTTGTGGMGLNIPYTHGEDRPSFQLLAKSSVGFAHSGLLFLLARTPGPTSFKEIKPAALIGYRRVDVRPVQKWGKPVELAPPQSESLEGLAVLDTRKPADAFKSEDVLSLAGVDTGENGFFARGEFECITYLGQMEFVTPQEIATIALHEITGRNTGKDVIQGLSGAVLDPSYRGGFLRPVAIEELREHERATETPSVAIGQLGPPQLTKLLFETHLLARIHPAISDWVEEKSSDEDIAARLFEELKKSGLDKIITSLGVPVRLPDGRLVLRGARITVPESVERMVPIARPGQIEAWTRQGWVDLRPTNVAHWRRRFREALEDRGRISREGSAAFARETYPYDEIRTGEVVGWIFNHEPLLGEDIVGGRIW